jgi:AcrR family transcriptional regulator
MQGPISECWIAAVSWLPSDGPQDRMGTSTKLADRSAKIVDAAAQLFARQGYHGTSTREIAQHAGISENTIFRYFPAKEDLFWAALNSRFSVLELRGDLVNGFLVSDEPQVVLPLILDLLVDTALLRPELLRLLAIAFIELRWKAEMILTKHLTPFFAVVSRYLEANIAKGKLRPLDPALLTAALASSVMVHPEIGRLLGNAPAYSDRKQAIRAYTQFWMDLLVTGAGQSPNSSSTRER